MLALPLATIRSLALSGKLHRVGRAGFEAQVPGDLQGADGVARGHRAAGARQQAADPAAAAEGAAGIDFDGGQQRTVDAEQPAIDQGRPAIGAVAAQDQAAGTGLDQAALVLALGGGLVAGHADGIVGAFLLAGAGWQAVFPALVLQRPLPGRVLGGVLGLALEQGAIGNRVAPFVAQAGREVGLEAAEQLSRPMHRPTEIRHAPADGVGGGAGRRAVELGGGGQQNLQRLLVVQVRIAPHDQGQRAGGVGRGHRGTGLVGVAAAGHGAVDQAAGRGDAPVLGDAAAVVALAVLLVEAGHGQPVAFQVRLEVGQGGRTLALA